MHRRKKETSTSKVRHALLLHFARKEGGGMGKKKGGEKKVEGKGDTKST